MKIIDSLLSRYRRMRLNEERRVKRQAIINVTPADRREQALALFEVRCMIEDTHPDYFNMVTFFGGDADSAEAFCDSLEERGHICESTACIAGFAVARFSRGFKPGYAEEGGWLNYEDEGRKVLHLDEEQANQLFFGKYGEYNEGRVDLDEATKEQALAVLDHLIATGKVRWDLATGAVDA